MVLVVGYTIAMCSSTEDIDDQLMSKPLICVFSLQIGHSSRRFLLLEDSYDHTARTLLEGLHRNGHKPSITVVLNGIDGGTTNNKSWTELHRQWPAWPPSTFELTIALPLTHAFSTANPAFCPVNGGSRWITLNVQSLLDAYNNKYSNTEISTMTPHTMTPVQLWVLAFEFVDDGKRMRSEWAKTQWAANFPDLDNPAKVMGLLEYKRNRFSLETPEHAKLDIDQDTDYDSNNGDKDEGMDDDDSSSDDDGDDDHINTITVPSSKPGDSFTSPEDSSNGGASNPKTSQSPTPGKSLTRTHSLESQTLDGPHAKEIKLSTERRPVIDINQDHRYTCPLCPAIFGSKGSALRHLNGLHGTFSCERCKKKI